MDNIDNIFANTAVFCKECGQQIKPGDRFCTYCGSTQTQEINIEPVNVEKKMRRRAAELLPCLKLLYAADVGWAAGAGRYAGSA